MKVSMFKLCITLLGFSGISFLSNSQSLGVESGLVNNNPSYPQLSGFFEGNNISGVQLPDQSYSFIHIINARHSNTSNNNQLQIGATYTENNRLFFRKISTGSLEGSSSNWHEIAVRNGNNNFSGKIGIGYSDYGFIPQFESQLHVNGNIALGNDYEAPSKIISGVGFSGAIEFKSNITTNGANNRYLRLGMVDNNHSFNPYLAITEDGGGSIGISTNQPEAKLDIRGNMILESAPYGGDLYTGRGSGELNRYLQILNSPVYQSASGLKAGGLLVSDSYSFANPGKNDLVVKGNVGIGTNNTGGFKLAVDGKIKAKEVKVTVDGWADYVFEPSYQLRPLADIESYIKENKHLPEVPSGESVKLEGIDLGKMDAALLKKIEELTLYLIDQNKKIEALNNKIALQDDKISVQDKLIKEFLEDSKN